MKDELPVRPGSLIEPDEDGIMTSYSVTELAGNRHRIVYTLSNDLNREITAQCFLTSKNSYFAGAEGINRLTREHAVRMSNIEPGETAELAVLVKGESPVIECMSDYRDFAGSESGGEETVIEVKG